MGNFGSWGQTRQVARWVTGAQKQFNNTLGVSVGFCYQSGIADLPEAARIYHTLPRLEVRQGILTNYTVRSTLLDGTGPPAPHAHHPGTLCFTELLLLF